MEHEEHAMCEALNKSFRLAADDYKGVEPSELIVGTVREVDMSAVPGKEE